MNKINSPSEFWNEVEVNDAIKYYKSKKFDKDVLKILGNHIPQVVLAVAGGLFLGGILTENAKAAGHDGIKGGFSSGHGNDLHTGEDAALSSSHQAIQRPEAITNSGLDWEATHVSMPNNIDIDSSLKIGSVLKIANGADLPFADNFGLPGVDKVEVTPYGGEGIFGVQEVMDVAVATLEANGITLDPSTVSAVTFVHDRSPISSDRVDRRPRSRSLPAENTTIVYGFEVGTNNGKAVMQVNEQGEAIGFRNQANLQAEQVVILDVYRSETGAEDGDSIGYYSTSNKFVPLIVFEGDNLAVSVPVDSDGATELHEPRGSSRARNLSASEFRRRSDKVEFTLESWAPTTERGAEFVSNLDLWNVPQEIKDSIKCEANLCYDADGKVIFDASTGQYGLDFIQEALSTWGGVGGPQEKPNPRSSRPRQPFKNGAIPNYSVKLASDFREYYKIVTGTDSRITGDSTKGRMESILVGEDSWMNAMGEEIADHKVIFNYIAYRPKADESKIEWYSLIPTPASEIDKIWGY